MCSYAHVWSRLGCALGLDPQRTGFYLVRSYCRPLRRWTLGLSHDSCLSGRGHPSWVWGLNKVSDPMRWGYPLDIYLVTEAVENGSHGFPTVFGGFGCDSAVKTGCLINNPSWKSWWNTPGITWKHVWNKLGLGPQRTGFYLVRSYCRPLRRWTLGLSHDSCLSGRGHPSWVWGLNKVSDPMRWGYPLDIYLVTEAVENGSHGFPTVFGGFGCDSAVKTGCLINNPSWKSWWNTPGITWKHVWNKLGLLERFLIERWK